MSDLEDVLVQSADHAGAAGGEAVQVLGDAVVALGDGVAGAEQLTHLGQGEGVLVRALNEPSRSFENVISCLLIMGEKLTLISHRAKCLNSHCVLNVKL